ncbi:MAG: ABC transporter ATP-binding protein, partial [Acutalibacteraceae bacterium]|nr:ABC transporter ATP-binding protein [Acutalibacteraceae bacterium]
MILCENLGKSYGSNEVLKDFSYSFGDNGFYLLFGPSGSGKTTLINIICGVLSFEEGTVLIDEEIFSGTPHWDMVRDKIGYVTQQVHFVDYLTVRENLLLASADDNAIQELLMKYGLYNRLNDFPAELSVGERQRIAIIQEVLTNKEILLLDEPTASLDPENKLIVFEMLKELSKKKCVICSSHDKQAKNYADDIINFKDISINGMTKEPTQDILNSVSKKEKSVQKKLPLSYFTRKWFSYKGRAKGAKIVLNIILILSI